MLNFWPFKREKPVPFEVIADGKPEVKCGDKRTHYFWEDMNGLTCPKCRAIDDHARKEAELDRLADKVAERLRAR